MATTTAPSGAAVHYDVVGDGSPVVLVHGLTDSGPVWAPVTERLARTRRVIVVDLPGHGRSEPAPSYDLLALAAGVTAVLDAEGLDRPDVVGHSLGGFVAAVLAATGRAASTVDVDQLLALGDFQGLLQSVEPALRDPEQFPATIAAIFEALDGPTLPPAERGRIRSLGRFDQDVVLGVWGTVLDTPLHELAATVDATATAIRVPFLSLHGSDPGPDYEAWLRERVPQAELEVWPDHGHYLHCIDPDRFVRRLEGFWQAAAPAG